MKKIFASILFLLIAVTGFSQVLEPVKWTGEIEKTGEDMYTIKYIAEIEDKWHLYDQQELNDGPIPTTFSYLDNADKIELIGKATESESHTSFDKIFNLDLTYFDKKATFTQKIKVLDPSLSSFIGEVSFQSCDDEKCIFDFREVEFALPGKSAGNSDKVDAGADDDSQIFEPVAWDSEVRKIGNDTYELFFNATIENKWHVYSTKSYDDIDPSIIAPNPTAIRLEDDSPFELVGSLKQIGTPHKTFDKIFEMDVEYFDGTASFMQTVKVSDASLKNLIITLDYQTCDDEKCIFPSKDFEFQIPDASTEIVSATGNTNNAGAEDDESDKGLWSIFIWAFLAGFAALLTPCVFPMIPMTVSFFTKQSKTKAAGIRNAIIYGLSIIVIYVILGTFVSLVFGADALNALSTNVWFNLIFFVLLIVFAASFLGAFEIMLPNSWANKVDRQADRGGYIGIFFMALALAIVSFSCTGPIVGTLLVEAASGGSQIGPIVGMFGFALAIALPFTLFAAFPGWLNSLPKSGGWLNTVKVVLGFLELALAFKFLSNADLVLQLHWLEREVFLAIWIAIFGALAFYLLGKIRLPHDSPVTHISVGRLMLALLVLSFTVYMIPGLWGAPLKLISGFPPAAHYSESPYGVGFSKMGGGSTSVQGDIPDGAKLLAPHDILTFTDYNKGVAYAKTVGKPIMIDFTGHACVNCRKMEENVWPNGNILSILKNEVVLISLYVDEKKELPDSEKYTSKETGKKVRTVGNKWSDLQIIKYKANAQPYYVLMNHDEENLIKPVGYTPDAKEYQKWLKDGISNFTK